MGLVGLVSEEAHGAAATGVGAWALPVEGGVMRHAAAVERRRPSVRRMVSQVRRGAPCHCCHARDGKRGVPV